MKVSSPDEENIRVIIEACRKDTTLFEVVESLAGLSEEEKRRFEAKMKFYFFDKTDSEDMEAMKFFKILLKGNNARLVAERIRGENP